MSILDFFKEKPYWHNEATKNKNEQRREFPGLSKEKHLPMLILNTKGENNLDLEVLVGEINNFISKVVKQKTNKVEYTDIQDGVSINSISDIKEYIDNHKMDVMKLINCAYTKDTFTEPLEKVTTDDIIKEISHICEIEKKPDLIRGAVIAHKKGIREDIKESRNKFFSKEKKSLSEEKAKTLPEGWFEKLKESETKRTIAKGVFSNIIKLFNESEKEDISVLYNFVTNFEDKKILGKLLKDKYFRTNTDYLDENGINNLVAFYDTDGKAIEGFHGFFAELENGEKQNFEKILNNIEKEKIQKTVKLFLKKRKKLKNFLSESDIENKAIKDIKEKFVFRDKKSNKPVEIIEKSVGLLATLAGSLLAYEGLLGTALGNTLQEAIATFGGGGIATMGLCLFLFVKKIRIQYEEPTKVKKKKEKKEA